MTARKPRFLANTITTAMSLSTAVAVVVCCALIAGIIYVALDRQIADELAHEAESIAEHLDGTDPDNTVENVKVVADFLPVNTRVTLIGQDGTVLFDNSGEDVSKMENHLSRPEVIEAFENGEGAAGRFSTTIGRETVYRSVLLDDNLVLRVARTQDSVLGIMGSISVPCAVVLIAVVLLSSFVGRLLARRIAASVSDIDLDHPLENDAYEEIVPLLCRIDDQRKRIDAAASERRAFTANVSHELKTPLTVISGYAEIMGNGLAAPEDTVRFSGLIHTEAQHMKDMVNDLIELSRLDDMGKDGSGVDLTQDVDLVSVLRESVIRLEQMAGEYDVSLSLIECEGDFPTAIKGNRRIICELAENLLSNAIRYNVAGGSVAASVVPVDASGEPIGMDEAAEGSADAAGIAMRVADTGVGIPAALRERVFERFYRVDESRSKETGGSGLGLAIVKHAAHLHGATISVEDNEPQGTVITITFPL